MGLGAIVFATVGVVGLVGLELAGGTQVSAAPDRAGAVPKLTVAAGIDGRFIPGRSLPVRVTITSDHLVRGDLRVEQTGSGASDAAVVVPVEVAGGSPKAVVVAIPTEPGWDKIEVAASLQGARGLEVTAVSTADGALHGTVRNTTEVPLGHVVVLVGTRSWDGGRLAPGEQVDWKLGPGEGDPPDVWSMPERPWARFSGLESDLPTRRAPVNYDLWALRMAAEVDPYAAGWVRAAGWTDRWDPPVDVGDELSGRTVFTTRAPVTAEGPGFAPDAVRRTVLRQEVDNSDMNLGPVVDLVLRLEPPHAAARMQLSLNAVVRGVEIWDGTRWSTLDCALADNPDASAKPTTCPLTAAAEGPIYLRVKATEDSITVFPGVDLEAAA